MAILSKEAYEWLREDASSLAEDNILGVLLCFALRVDHDEYKRLLREAHNSEHNEEERKKNYETALAMPYDTKTFGFSVTGWEKDDLIIDEFMFIDLDGFRMYIPPKLDAFLDGKKLGLGSDYIDLVVEGTVEDADILAILTTYS